MNYFNPDESASKIRNEMGCSVNEANGLTWYGSAVSPISISSSAARCRSSILRCPRLVLARKPSARIGSV